MTDRIHERDVKTALKQVMLRYPRGTRFQYEPVEPSVGAPARLFLFDEDHRRTSFPGLDHGMLGWTRKEAYRTLVGIEAGMEAQRLVQAETIRRAVTVLSRASFAWNAADAEESAEALGALAPPTEF